MSDKLAWASLAVPATPLVLVIILLFPLPLLWSYEQPSIVLDFDSVSQHPEISFETVTLEKGNNKIHGSAYYNGYLWFSTRTNPTRILKMDPDTLEYEQIILDRGLNDGEDLIAAQGFIFVILCDYPTKVIKINPDNLTVEKTIEIEKMNRGGSLLYDFGYLWAGGAGKLARINTSDYSYTIYEYPTSNQFHALTSGNGFLWGSCPRQNELTFIVPETIIFKIDPKNPEEYDSITIRKTVTDDMTYLDGALYVGTENLNFGTESFIYQIFNNLTYISATTKERIRCYGIFQDSDGFLWAAYTGNPGRVIKFNNKLELINVIELPNSYNDANEIIFDAKGNMFITCFQSPAQVVRLSFLAS